MDGTCLVLCSTTSIQVIQSWMFCIFISRLEVLKRKHRRRESGNPASPLKDPERLSPSNSSSTLSLQVSVGRLQASFNPHQSVKTGGGQLQACGEENFGKRMLHDC